MKISVIGAGSWGTAIVSILSKKNHVNWWVRRERLINQIILKKRNTKYLTNCKLNTKNITFFQDIDQIINNSDLIIVAIPSEFIFSVFKNKGDLLNSKTILSAVKGVIPEKNTTPHDFFKSISPNLNYGVISGPCHAEEVALEKQSYLTISTNNNDIHPKIKKIFNTKFINIKTSNDIVGTEYAAILKNIYAILIGVAYGLGYGDNFIAVLTTSCANEMKRLLQIIDPKERTISQPAYLGDLLVTCYSSHSRNRSLGVLIGKGYSVENAIEKMTMVAEGYHAAASIYARVHNLKIIKKTPIISSAFNVLHKEKDPRAQLKKLENLIS
jgi:glycerol-3-phosphate dehydrogenase (NAD(P)+)|tara:strand:+ start:492 stop:1472 length:981 start_codon:yes stop_codon:yes gene_type:complete